MELLLDAHFWVGVALVVLLSLLGVLGVHKLIWKVLGDAGETVRAQLDEATRLREEAQALLVQIRAQAEAAEKHAAEVMAKSATRSGV